MTLARRLASDLSSWWELVGYGQQDMGNRIWATGLNRHLLQAEEVQLSWRAGNACCLGSLAQQQAAGLPLCVLVLRSLNQVCQRHACMAQSCINYDHFPLNRSYSASALSVSSAPALQIFTWGHNEKRSAAGCQAAPVCPRAP